MNVIKGRKGEDEAARFLKGKGYRVLVRNYRCRFGEIDLVCKDGDTVVFVEVKARGTELFGQGKESVGYGKRRKMTVTSSHYLAEKGLTEHPVRYDVISLRLRDGVFEVEHIKNAFDAVE